MDRLGIVLLSAMLLPACASQIPEQTRSASSRNTPTETNAHPGTQRFNGEPCVGAVPSPRSKNANRRPGSK